MYIGPSNQNAQIIEKATVQVSYNAIDEDEISVHVGDVVDVISRVTEDEGWWKVSIPHMYALMLCRVSDQSSDNSNARTL
jgi:hypothetical protein